MERAGWFSWGYSRSGCGMTHNYLQVETFMNSVMREFFVDILATRYLVLD